MIVLDSERPVLEPELKSIESKYGFNFPSQYRAFLLQHNGGRPEPARFQFLDANGPYSDSLVNWFLAIYDGECDNFEKAFRALKVEHVRIPQNLVPIADDPFGNMICISVSGDDVGAVYFWDHEKDADCRVALPPTRDNFDLIAHSFNEFLAGLR